jgi:hypothetical protein
MIARHATFNVYIIALLLGERFRFSLMEQLHQQLRSLVVIKFALWGMRCYLQAKFSAHVGACPFRNCNLLMGADCNTMHALTHTLFAKSNIAIGVFNC